MQLWEYMLSEDREHDLPDLSAARAWSLSGEPPPFNDPWHPSVSAAWVDAVRTLRSIAKRLKKAKCRDPEITPERADEVFSDYLRMLHPTPVRSDEKPIRQATFLGVRLTARVDVNDPRMFEPWGGWAMFADNIWATTFGSMVSDDFDPVCNKCGDPLGLTPKGRKPRAGMCKKCRYADWYSKQSPEALRRRWRETKTSLRSRQERA